MQCLMRKSYFRLLRLFSLLTMRTLRVLRSRQLRARMRRPGERRTYGQQLLAEHAAYYAKQPLVLPGPAQRLGGVEKYQLVQGQRVRKRDHRERAARLRADMI